MFPRMPLNLCFNYQWTRLAGDHIAFSSQAIILILPLWHEIPGLQQVCWLLPRTLQQPLASVRGGGSVVRLSSLTEVVRLESCWHPQRRRWQFIPHSGLQSNPLCVLRVPGWSQVKRQMYFFPSWKERGWRWFSQSKYTLSAQYLQLHFQRIFIAQNMEVKSNILCCLLVNKKD